MKILAKWKDEDGWTHKLVEDNLGGLDVLAKPSGEPEDEKPAWVQLYDGGPLDGAVCRRLLALEMRVKGLKKRLAKERELRHLERTHW